MLYRFVLRACTFSLALTLALFAASSPAHADARTEAAAKGLETKAMQEDYLATDFDKALEKLNQAAGKCGADKCSSILRAQIKRDIGVTQVAKQSREAAVAAFTEALRADPNVQLDPDTRTKEIDAAWSEAKKQAASAAPVAGPPPAGDFTLQPAAETLVRTPLDIYGDYSGSEALAKVVLKYKSFGMPDWKTLEMKNLADKGWGVEIPCVDVTEGDLRFYVQGFNANNDPVATAGDRNTPFHTAVKRTLAGEVPHFPGKDAPRQCADTGDCPPDFPGCKKPSAGENPDSNLKEEGKDCEEDSECKSGTCTKEKTCAAGEGQSTSKRRKFWIGVAGAFDFVHIPTGTDVCVLTPQATPLPIANGYYCTVNGQDFPARTGDPTGQENSDIQPGQSDKVSGGFAPGNVRIMASFDYAATSNAMVGVRLGYVANGYNGQAATNEGKAFLPIIIEARGTYVIGKNALDQAGLAPYAMLAGGLSQYSAQVGVTVISRVTAAPPAQVPPPPSPPLCARPPTGQSLSCTTNAQAWSMSGPGFVSLGAGIRYGFTPAVALLFGPRFNLAFGANGVLISLSPELGLQYGF